MKSFYTNSLVILTVILSVCSGNLFAQTTSYTSVGTFSYTVPAGVTAVGIDMAGAQGGNGAYSNAGGKGGRIQCTLAVTPGQVLSVYVGGQGTSNTCNCCCGTQAGGANGSGGAASGGSGQYYAGGGGGSSDIRIGGTSLSNRVAVAAGGGGGADWCGDIGGDGGGASGSNGVECGSYNTCGSGAGGSQTSGGAGASCGGASGGLGNGGNGNYYGAGGGGGYYGGGGGEYGSAGGGSSYPTSGATTAFCTAVTNTGGYQSGNGYVNICAPNVGSIGGNVPLCSGQTMNLIPSVPGGTWSSANTAIATVSSTGVVTAVSAGTVNITYTAVATCGAGYLVTAVLVNTAPGPIVGSPSICAGSTATLTDGGTGTWSSSNPARATIGSGTGVVTGVASGTVNISYTFTTTGCSSVLPMTVNPLPPAITGVPYVCAGGSTTALSDAASGGSWTSSSPTNATVTGTGIVTGLAAGNTMISYTLPTGCQITQPVTVNPLPNPITGTGVVCVGNTTVLSDAGGGTWSSSNTAQAAVGPTGSVLGVSAGSPNITYTLSTGCSTSVPVLVNPVPAPIGGTASVCASGGTTTLSNTTPGGIWFSSNTTYATVLPTTGAVTGVGSGTVTISYTLGTGCAATVPLVVNPLPIAYAVTGGGGYCVGAPGVHIGLSFASTGINYKLYNGTTLVATVAGSSSGLDFGPQTAVGTYTVVAADATTLCTNNMTGSTTVAVNPLPVVFSVSGGGSFCAGATGPHIMLSGSDPSVNYQLFAGGIPTGGSLSGTGGPLNFGSVTAPGIYTAVGTNPATSCSIGMTGSANVVVNPLPTVYSLNAGGGYCAGGAGIDIVLSGSDLSATYQLYFGGLPSGSPFSGTGSPLHFGYHTSPGVYSVSAINPTTTCADNMTGATTIAVNALPVIYNVSGGGSFCAGGAGVHVGLNYSNTGVNYQLYRSSVPVGSVVAGTNSGLDFGPQTVAGVYTVVAIDQVSGCMQNMAGSATVSTTPLPAAFSVIGGGSFCTGGVGVHIGLSGSATGIHYQLYNGSSVAGAAVNGTGAPIDFGLRTAAGTYTVVATNITTSCAGSMTGSASIAVNPLPAVYLVSGGGTTTYCAGGPGIDITLSGSDPAVSYTLYRGATAVGSPLTGTGSNLDFSYQTAPGTYTVTGTTTGTGCSSVMAGSAPVIVNSLPARYTVTGGGSFCAGGVGVHIGLSSSAPGVNYQLFNTSGTIGGPVAGLGSALDFGYNTAADVYQVIATNVLTSCADTMNGVANVVQNMLPAVHNVTGGGNYCPGGAGADIALDGSDTGVVYQLFLGSAASGSPVTGAGSTVDFGYRIPVGTYTVTATNPATTCSASMNGSATVGHYPLPALHNVTGGGTYCTPGGAGVNVNLDGSDAGVNYQLYFMGAPVTGGLVPGTGSSIGFGLQTGVGSYAVVATDAATFCHDNMAGLAVISTLPQPNAYSLTGGGQYCAGGTGVNVGLSGSDAGISYQLYNTGAAVGSPVTGTGLALNFGMQTAAGPYTVVASPGGLCQLNMTGTSTVVMNPLPNPYMVTGGGSYCNGAPGVSVGLSNSDAGVSYQLYLGTAPVGGTVAGTGSAISFGVQTAAGTYKTKAIDSFTTCATTVGAGGSAVISSLPLPVAFPVTGGGHYCTGGPGVHVTLGGSSTNVNYQLYNIAGPVGSPMPGTGTLLDFGLQTTAGPYTVTGRNAATSCLSNMADTAIVAIDAVQNPVVTITAHPGLSIVKQQRDTLVANATTAGLNALYQWLLNGFPIPGATNSTFVSRNFADSDVVTCVVTSNGGNCTGYTSNHTVVIRVTSGVGVQQVYAGEINVNVVPNPNRGAFSVIGSLSSGDDQEVTIEVTDLLGHVVYNNRSTAKNGEVNERIQLGGNIANGMYILSLRAGAESKVFHVVIEQ